MAESKCAADGQLVGEVVRMQEPEHRAKVRFEAALLDATAADL